MKCSVYIQYLYGNILYGWAMSEPLPFANFMWMTEDELSDAFGKLIKGEETPPCTLEVNIAHPENLHDDHNVYPVLPEMIKVNGVDKLIPMLALNNKKNYVVHHRRLKYPLSKGLILMKLHNGISYH